MGSLPKKHIHAFYFLHIVVQVSVVVQLLLKKPLAPNTKGKEGGSFKIT
jgi:hypothetical protein